MRKFQVTSKSGIFAVLQPCYRFAEFTVDANQKVLLCNGAPVPLTPKVFDTLLILVENAGRIVEKDDLMNRLWPDTFVEEANLTFNIRQLRKAFGYDAREPRFIETVARRGYRFVAEMSAAENKESSVQVDASLAEAEPSRQHLKQSPRQKFRYAHSLSLRFS